MKTWLKTGREMVVESGKVAKERTRDGRKSEQGQDEKMVEDVSEDRTRRGRGGRKGQDRRWLKMGHLSVRWEQTGYKKVVKEKDRTGQKKIM